MWYEPLLTSNIIPEKFIRSGIRSQLQQKLRIESEGGEALQRERFEALLDELRDSPIALSVDRANEQHYELPARFFASVLGTHLKYSSGYWPEGVCTLDEAEEAMLGLYCERARLADGQEILDLGCGWGSLSLFLAERFPKARVLGVSNSATQKAFILERAAARGFNNVSIQTNDMNTFETDRTFDRIVSIEMFEHMRNYEKLLAKVSSWMKSDARLFVHLFCHRKFAYPYRLEDPSNWMAQYFFTGGLMPSQELLTHFNRHLRLEGQWLVNGVHYQKTCEAWLCNMDTKKGELWPLFEETYGKKQARKWWAYWRVFFMACAELFGFQNGNEWFVAHYLFEKNAA